MDLATTTNDLAATIPVIDVPAAPAFDRRREPRSRCEDVIRWKRPGRIEDNRAWACDRSDGGLGFLTDSTRTPQVGDWLNVRRFDHGVWDIIDQTVRVTRVTPTPCHELCMVGCTVG